MTPEERNLIASLFDRLATTSNQPKDPEADQLIRSKVAENPAAPYLLAQSTLVMQQALANAQSRIGALEKQIAESNAPAPGTQQGGSFLSSVASFFGGSQQHQQPQRSTPPPVPPQPQQPQPQQYVQPQPPPAYGAPQPQAPAGRGSGGFLQGALGTAAGVAGGALLFQGIENLIGHNPGPFAGSITPSGGFFGGGERPVENTEITNYYNEPDPNRSDSQAVDQESTDQNVYSSADPDPDPDPNIADDYTSDDLGSDSGGDDDSTYV
jgi:uncharacterized protein